MGNYNTASGDIALRDNTTGSNNVATGQQALLSNVDGGRNTAVGASALFVHTSGNDNTAIGFGALSSNTTGAGNIALGSDAGAAISTGNSNIDIGNAGLAGDSHVMRIGETQFQTFIAGISGVNEGGTISAVYINTNGQLGTQPPPSSRRFKDSIKPMDQTSEAILSLRPVTFQYKSDTKGIVQFGLVAEEVAKVNPDLVVRDADGTVYSVRYEAVNAMLLNEFLKEHRTVKDQGATITELKREVEDLVAVVKEQAGQIQKLSAQRQTDNADSHVALNNP